MEQLRDVTNTAEKTLAQKEIWLGGLFYPEAFLIATRQMTAEHLSCAMEELGMKFSIGAGVAATGGLAFHVKGMVLVVDGLVCGLFCAHGHLCIDAFIQGCKWSVSSGVDVGPSVFTKLPTITVSWEIKEKLTKECKVQLPLYVNQDRSVLLCSVDLETTVDRHQLYLRGAALIANTMDGEWA